MAKNCPEADPMTCRRCGKADHIAKDCPEPQTCYFCREEGHISRDCQKKPKMTCHHCNQEGHLLKECPIKPPAACLNCHEEGKFIGLCSSNSTLSVLYADLNTGHTAFECKVPRKLDRLDIAEMPMEEAWVKIMKGAQERDIDDIKDAIQTYVKANPDITYQQLEESFREQDIKVWLVAIEKPVMPTLTNMDLQGNLGKKYTVTYRLSPTCPRPRDRDLWPASPEENMERLADAGEVVPSYVPKCNNCDEMGHFKSDCPQEKREAMDQVQLKCYNCEEVGHRLRDCKLEPHFEASA